MCFFPSILANSQENGLTNDEIFDRPHMTGDSIINATLGKRSELTCIVNNLKNYKVSFFFFFL